MSNLKKIVVKYRDQSKEHVHQNVLDFKWESDKKIVLTLEGGNVVEYEGSFDVRCGLPDDEFKNGLRSINS